MRHEAKITSKGQITIPVALRRVLGVGPGDRLVFESAKGAVVLKAERKKGVFAKYQGIAAAASPMTKKEVVRSIREMRGR